MEFEEVILIPKTRVAVLIGTKGSVKRALEKSAKVKLKISANGSVFIKGKDALEVMTAKSIVEAIGRGFNPVIAKTLLNEDFSFVLMHIEDYVGKRKDLDRIRGVLIGAEGRARRILEEATGTNISIQGKTVAIIGPAEGVSKARQAVEMFLTGARHATVYKFLGRHDD